MHNKTTDGKDTVYEVAWVINVIASTPEEAARKAMKLRDSHDSDRIDNYFHVMVSGSGNIIASKAKGVDLDKIDGRI